DDPKHQQYTYGNLTDSPNFENPLRDRAASLLYYDTPEERENATWKMGLPRPPLGYGYAHTKNWKPEDQFNANKALLHDRILKNQDWWKPHNNYTLEGVAKAYSTEFGKTLTNGELLIYSSFMNRGYNEEQSIQQFQDWMAKFNKIYRLSREDSVYDSVIGFFAEHPDA
ncbi:hypothetical protein, partial [Klebsiella pneumoniae]|uniref:hypothetical protein n=1 Tax=Klebsiella pneumoniae TaxID=573 RepID=UPI00385299C1